MSRWSKSSRRLVSLDVCWCGDDGETTRPTRQRACSATVGSALPAFERQARPIPRTLLRNLRATAANQNAGPSGSRLQIDGQLQLLEVTHVIHTTDPAFGRKVHSDGRLHPHFRTDQSCQNSGRLTHTALTEIKQRKLLISLAHLVTSDPPTYEH